MLPKDLPEFNLEQGVVMLIDKPLEWTSFDVVNKLRYTIKRAFGLKKVKVGHAGTLDPLAGGLLIVCAGKATKTIDQIQAEHKKYTGIITIGAKTPSFDLETEVEKVADADHISLEEVQNAANQFLGVIDQTPPIFSAKKIDGKTAYNLARAGKEVKLKKAQVEIMTFDIVKKEGVNFHFEVTCSKGTYIRSLANDVGEVLGVGGYLSALRRTQSGDSRIEEAKTVEQWVDFIAQLPNNQKTEG